MVNFSATLVFLFCLIAIAPARSSPELDGSTAAMAMPITEESPELRDLPSKPVADSDSNTAAISMPITEAKPEVRDLPIKPVGDESDSNAVLFTALPLTRATFLPVNRRFPVRPRFPCRHHFKIEQIKMEDKEIPYGNDMLVSTREVPYGDDALIASREVPYGNDMILRAGENSDFEEPVPRGEMQRIPGRWVRLHHHHHHHDEDSDSDSDDDGENDRKIVFNKRYNHGRFDREKKLKSLMKMRKQFLDRIEVEKQKNSGFMGVVRRFLDNYF